MRTHIAGCALATALALAVSTAAAQGTLDYPPAAKRPVSETFHGVTVVDDYRWMEDVGAADVKAWVREENALTRKFLDSVPQRAAIARRVGELLRARTIARYDFRYRGGVVFAMKYAPPKNQSALVVLPLDLDVGKERVVLDPTVLDPTGTNDDRLLRAVLRWQARRAVAVEERQRSRHRLRARRRNRKAAGRHRAGRDTGRRRAAASSGPATARASTTRDTRRRASAPRPIRASTRRSGSIGSARRSQPTSYVIGRDFPRIAEIALHGSRDGKDLVASVRNGDGGEIAYYLKRSRGEWQRVADFTDGIKEMEIGQDGNLYARSIKGAPLGKILAIPLADARLASAKVIVPEAALSADSLSVARSRLYVQYRDGGPSVVRMFDLKGKELGALPAEPVSETTVNAILDGDNAIVRVMSFITPSIRYRYDAGANRLVETALNGKPPFNFDDAAVERGFAVSKDGTRIPVMILHRKDVKLDGTNPTLLYAYGGYGISMTPYFSGMNRLWLDYGGVYALAAIRGGGEYGDAWHLAGNLTRKQNVFDDFAASHAVSRRPQVHEPGPSRHHGREQRWPDDGCRRDAAPRDDACRREPGGDLRRIALGDTGQRRIQRHRVRQHQGPGPVQGALRVFTAAAREGRRQVPGGAAHDRRKRRARRALRVVQVRGAPAGCHVVGQSHSASHRGRSGARHRHGAGNAYSGSRPTSTRSSSDQLGIAGPVKAPQ